MLAAMITGICDITADSSFLSIGTVPDPSPGQGEMLIRVSACGVCHTEIDEIEGRTPPATYPMIPGHEVVGTVAAVGSGVSADTIGQRVGVGWYFSSCGSCTYCLEGRRNLCADFKATGRDVPGGYAEFMVVPETAAFPIPAGIDDYSAAPLLCAGAVGYRALEMTGIESGKNLGLSGFGASARLILDLVVKSKPGVPVYVFARSESQRESALASGATWAGDIGERPPLSLHAIVDTTPAWKPVIWSLECLRPGGTLIINAIRKEPGDRRLLQEIRYEDHLWLEKSVTSVANVTPGNLEEFLRIAGAYGIVPSVDVYPLSSCELALKDLRGRGSVKPKVLRMET